VRGGEIFKLCLLLLDIGPEARPIKTHLSVEHVHVFDPVSRVNTAGVRLEQAKRERFGPGIALVREERVGIDGEGRAIVLLKRQQASERVLEHRVKRPGGGRVGLAQHRHGVDGGDPYLASKGCRVEGILDIPHGRKELRNQALIHGHHDLVANGDERDVAGGVVGDHVRVHPSSRGVRIGGQRRNLAVGSTDDDSDAGSSKGLDDSTVDAIEPNFSNSCGLEEVRSRCRRWKVVGNLAVIHTNE
jgi:hypothetical protein